MSTKKRKIGKIKSKIYSGLVVVDFLRFSLYILASMLAVHMQVFCGHIVYQYQRHGYQSQLRFEIHFLANS